MKFNRCDRKLSKTHPLGNKKKPAHTENTDKGMNRKIEGKYKNIMGKSA